MNWFQFGLKIKIYKMPWANLAIASGMSFYLIFQSILPKEVQNQIKNEYLHILAKIELIFREKVKSTDVASQEDLLTLPNLQLKDEIKNVDLIKNAPEKFAFVEMACSTEVRDKNICNAISDYLKSGEIIDDEIVIEKIKKSFPGFATTPEMVRLTDLLKNTKSYSRIKYTDDDEKESLRKSKIQKKFKDLILKQEQFINESNKESTSEDQEPVEHKDFNVDTSASISTDPAASAQNSPTDPRSSIYMLKFLKQMQFQNHGYLNAILQQINVESWSKFLIKVA